MNDEEAKRKIKEDQERARKEKKPSEEQRPKSVLEMKQVKEGPVKGCGRIVGVGEQYQAVSRIDAECDAYVDCRCKVNTPGGVVDENTHERPCGYKLYIDYTVDNSRPPTPVIISAFDTGNGKPQVCPRCKQYDIRVEIGYRRAKLIQLQDIDNRTDNARQDVILYDNMVDNLEYNEIIQVEGKMFVERRPGASKNSMMDNRLHASSVVYLKKKDVIITEDDVKLFHKWKENCIRAQAAEIEAVNRFKQQAKQYNCVACQQLARKIIPMSVVDRQAAAIAPNIIGHLPAKQGMLRTLVGATKRGPGRLKGKIQTLFIGDKGTSKSSIGDEGGHILPNSAKVTATHATGKAITGIVDADSKMLVLGILPASDFAIIDEADKLPGEEQARLLGILEENHFGKDAYGLHYEVDTDVAIIATANPTNTDWRDSQKISTDEIGILDTLKDRFTQIFTFRDDLKSREKRMPFAKRFAAIRRKEPPNYTFFRKLWIYAGGLRPELTLDAEKILYEFWACRDNDGAIGLMDTRFLNHIFKIAEAEAKLNLSEEVDETIADETQKAIMIMLIQYGENIKTIVRQSEITENKFLEILENTRVGITIEELCRQASKEDTQIGAYLGNIWTLQDNKILRKIIEAILKHNDGRGRVKKTREKPIVLQWFDNEKVVSDLYDLSDRDPATITVDEKTFLAKNDTKVNQAPKSSQAKVGIKSCTSKSRETYNFT